MEVINPPSGGFFMADTSASQFNIPAISGTFDFGKQTQQTNDWMSALSKQIPALRAGIESGLGLPQMRQALLGNQAVENQLQTQIGALPSTIAGTTRDSLVTDAQRQALINAQSVPLTKNLADVQRGTANLQNTLNMAQTTANQAVTEGSLPFEVGTNALAQQQAREFTGYTNDMQRELDRLVANQKAGLQWTTDEANRAQQLAIAEKNYQNQLEQIAASGNQARLTKAANPDMATLLNAFSTYQNSL